MAAPSLRSVAAEPQLGFDEQVLENPALEKALETRQEAKGLAGVARATYQEAHDTVLAKLDELQLTEDEPIRVGRFRITKRLVEGRSVAFDTQDSDRISIKVLD